LTFIDVENTAVYGHGYGGYIALLVLAADIGNLFKCAIAVSPITKWEFYSKSGFFAWERDKKGNDNRLYCPSLPHCCYLGGDVISIKNMSSSPNFLQSVKEKGGFPLISLSQTLSSQSQEDSST
jgi:hypothetical protein